MIPNLLLSVLAGCLSHQVSPTYVITESCFFNIPINYNSRLVNKLQAIELWASTDRGRSWSRYAILSPSEKTIRAVGPNEGELWLGLHLEYKDGRIEPPHRDKPASIIKLRFDLNPAARAANENWRLAQSEAAAQANRERQAAWSRFTTAFWQSGSSLQSLSPKLQELHEHQDLVRSSQDGVKPTSDALFPGSPILPPLPSPKSPRH
jgi:hypothetical protein